MKADSRGLDMILYGLRMASSFDKAFVVKGPPLCCSRFTFRGPYIIAFFFHEAGMPFAASLDACC